MLDAETKARIDSARDILVGKVPDPKSQVEQITIALIYKFMDDMDRQSEELGGKTTFFTGDFKKYRWANLLDKRLGGHERLNLYAEGLDKMNLNRNIPQLFRDIFKGVFLPYRDPETLNLFLKEIDCFTYDHSERLGDAYEYLLSVLGTQGEAGQFRTPRHIIDFIVAVVYPKKHETVLDPACGTAGFLISAYKHILYACAEQKVELTPDERARLMTNFRGYDIAPDMVRLSRVNLYLHGFPNPIIHEYDTLTSEERWDERCDVIMANPPFMSPKGGIRPHNRFSIKAKRSEVLFVDYIAEHLNPSGRAGIIVPEGIIFQGQNAYKALRKMLVENYLWAVVSLPAGVFNPYSGVKTSILFLDRNLARRTDEVLFVKVESDGFDLGAQRRPNGKNDLPKALEILDSHKKTQKAQEGKMVLTVSRKRLLEAPDISLAGDRYRTAAVRHVGKWPMVKLGEVGDFVRGVTYDKTDESPVPTTVAVLRANNIDLVSHALNLTDIRYLREGVHLPAEKILKRGDIFICTASGSKEHLGKVAFVSGDTPFYFGGFMGCVRCSSAALPRFVFYAMTSPSYDDFIRGLTAGVNINNLKGSDLLSFEIPLPPLDEQERIVAELEGYRKVIEGARQVIASYKPTLRIDPKWLMTEIGDVCEINPKESGLAKFSPDTQVSFIPMADVALKTTTVSPSQTRKLNEVIKGYTNFRQNDVLLAKITPCFENGKVAIVGPLVNDLGFGSTEFIVIRCDPNKILPPLLLQYVSSNDFRQVGRLNMTGSAGQQRVRTDFIREYEIPLPPLAVQHELVAELEAERKLVEANRDLIGRMEAKIKAKLAEVWEAK